MLVSLLHLFFFFFGLLLYLLFTNLFGLLNLQKIAKENPTNPVVCLITYFGMNEIISCLCFFTSIHMMNSMFWVYVIHISKWNWNDHMARDYHFTISQKGLCGNFWLDPRFPRSPKLKWILKWLPLDRGYLNFTFYKRRKFANNPMPYISLNS